jgi:hypothetical protein
MYLFFILRNEFELKKFTKVSELDGKRIIKVTKLDIFILLIIFHVDSIFLLDKSPRRQFLKVKKV